MLKQPLANADASSYSFHREKGEDESALRVEEARGMSGSMNKSFWQSPYLWVAIVMMITLPLVRPLMRRIPKPPPVFGVLPFFELIDQDGKAFGLKDMKGHVYLVKFFFTRCQTICPKMMKAMRKLQEGFALHNMPIRLLSITVDPEYDTPNRLRNYSKSLGLHTSNWSFLSGAEKDVIRLANTGFKTAIGRAQNKENLMDISHSGKLILVDKRAQIRGYYSISEIGVREAFHRTQHVLYEEFHK